VEQRQRFEIPDSGKSAAPDRGHPGSVEAEVDIPGAEFVGCENASLRKRRGVVEPDIPTGRYADNAAPIGREVDALPVGQTGYRSARS